MDLSNRLTGPYIIPSDVRIPFPYNPREHLFGLHAEILSCLRVSARAIPPRGEQTINVNEEFKVKITGSNIAPEAINPEDPVIMFHNPIIWVTGTEYAELKNPTYGNRYTARLPDNYLYPGESSYIEVDFIARQAIEFAGESPILEHIADVSITAQMNPNMYFVFNKSIRVNTNIAPT